MTVVRGPSEPANDQHGGRFAPIQYPSERLALKAARSRCERTADKDYARYGGRGIAVCDAWKGPDGFHTFMSDVGPKPTPRHTLDRIDVNGNYTPSNVRWATWEEQANNRRRNRHITWQGETHTAAEWAQRLGMRRQEIVNRINRGWSLERAMTTPAPLPHGVASQRPANDNADPRDAS